jgi:hypothetical protein
MNMKGSKKRVRKSSLLYRSRRTGGPDEKSYEGFGCPVLGFWRAALLPARSDLVGGVLTFLHSQFLVSTLHPPHHRVTPQEHPRPLWFMINCSILAFIGPSAPLQ